MEYDIIDCMKQYIEQDKKNHIVDPVFNKTRVIDMSERRKPFIPKAKSTVIEAKVEPKQITIEEFDIDKHMLKFTRKNYDLLGKRFKYADWYFNEYVEYSDDEAFGLCITFDNEIHCGKNRDLEYVEIITKELEYDISKGWNFE